jgi:hypothetical protein
MAVLPKVEKTTIQLAMECLNDELNVSDKRAYLGMSAIGSNCHRKLQYLHYGCVQVSHSSRINRLFEDGHNAESQLKRELEKIGICVYNEQKELIGITGHIKGHIDGIGLFLHDKFKFTSGSFLVEYKTHNKDNFRSVKTKGVKASHPGHYDQMIMYMHHLDLKFGLYVGKCKDNSEIYLEIIEYSEEHFDVLQRRVIEVITAETLLPRIGNDNPTWFECKLCDACDICFGREEPSKDCRNCEHVDVLDEGKWKCTLHNEILTSTAICNGYKMSNFFNV